MTSGGNYICLPCWAKKSRRQNEDAILKRNWVLRNTEIRRTQLTISLSFWGIKNTSSYFSFEASLVLRIPVCLFLPGSQTLSWDIQRWVPRKFDQVNNIDVFMKGQIYIGLLFINLHCVPSVFMSLSKWTFREHVVWWAPISNYCGCVWRSNKNTRVALFELQCVLHAEFRSRKLPVCYLLTRTDVDHECKAYRISLYKDVFFFGRIQCIVLEWSLVWANPFKFSSDLLCSLGF